MSSRSSRLAFDDQREKAIEVQVLVADSIRLRRRQGIDAPADEMRNKLSIVVVEMAEQPSLDEIRQSVRNVKILCALFEFFELFH